MTGQDKHERQTLQYKLMCRVKHNYTIYNVKGLNMFDIDRLLFYKGQVSSPLLAWEQTAIYAAQNNLNCEYGLVMTPP